jgi:predicted dehydrogenase
MSTSEKLGFAILGAGMIADYHRQAIEANADLGARLVAMGHYNPARFDEISAKYEVPCVSQAELLANPEVHIICLCTPSGQHAEQTIAAAEAGKHVLVEKPMALSLADADAMIESCRQAAVKLGVTLQRRAEPIFKQVKAAIQGGDLGDLTLGVVTMPYYRPQTYFNQAEWRGTWALDGGGVLMNQGIHLVDLLVWFMGDPTQVQAYADTLHRDIEVEDTLAATLHFANGSLATISATTTASPGFPHRLEIFGTNGGIQVEGESVGRWTLVDPLRATVEPPEITTATDAGAGGDPRGIKATGHIAIFRDFIRAVQVNGQPEIDGLEGRRSLAAVLAVYEAAGLLK